jgi:hypothetical protein
MASSANRFVTQSSFLMEVYCRLLLLIFNKRHALPMSLGRSFFTSAIMLLLMQGFKAFFQSNTLLHLIPWPGWHTSFLNGHFLPQDLLSV